MHLPVVVVSGWANSVRSLEPLTREWSEHTEVTPIAIEELQESGGRSSAVAHGAMADKQGSGNNIYASSLLERLDAFDQPVLLAGWSMGGMIAMEAAIAGHDRIAGLVLLASTPRFCKDNNAPFGKSTPEVRALSLGIRTMPEPSLGYGSNAKA